MEITSRGDLPTSKAPFPESSTFQTENSSLKSSSHPYGSHRPTVHHHFTPPKTQFLVRLIISGKQQSAASLLHLPLPHFSVFWLVQDSGAWDWRLIQSKDFLFFSFLCSSL
uniref:Uncharacterized protein n=1 Tax=Cucumis sativus TaxID=3659 RepID=A0A0A0LYA4_CUCSA